MDRLKAFCLGIWLTGLTIGLGGCGSSSTPTDTPAPAPNSSQPPAVTGGEPEMSGGMKLPPGEVPSPESLTPPASGSKAGGMQLPSDFDPSQNDQSSTGSGEVDLRLATWAEVQTAVKATGKVTVLDVWSLGCGPCLREYPNLVALQQRYPDRIVAIGANVDYDGRRTRPPESYEPRIRDFLTSTAATFTNFLVQTPSDEVFETLKISSIPTVLIFDAKGTLVQQFVDAGETAGFTYESDVTPAVEQLL